MEDFTVPMLTESGFNGSNHTTHLHHHKDHMLSAGNTPATPFIYEITNKPEHTSVKSDYAAFTNCIQQSALLDHRAVETNVDGVSLSSLCDLKFPSPPSLSVSLNTDSNFKNLSLMSGIEANHVLVTKSAATNMEGHSSDMNSDPGPSFTNLLFPRDVEPKTIQNCVQTQVHHYLTLKSTESDGNFLQRSTATTVTPNSCESNLIGFGIGSTATKNNHMQHVQSTAHRVSSNINSNYIGENGAHLSALEMNNIDCESSVNASIGNNISADNHITTTTTSTITTTASKNTHSINNNNIINNSSSNNVPTRSTMASIDNLAASSCSAAAAAGAAASVCNSNSNNNNNNASISKITQEEPNANHHNLSNLSSDCDSQSSSEEEFVDLEISERCGYQDNTSSHSQQSASGGGGTSASNSAGVALLNGVGGSNSNVSGGGGYMSLLQPAVGATSSSGHHGGGGGGGSNGTSASAGGSGEGIDFKHLFEELCPVCGDKVSGYHYGLLTCESCKGFFKRTVQNKKVYTCVAERSCHIDKTQRKRCPYCRFQKCLEVGMKLEAVRADRMRGGRNKFGPMYKRDRARKLQVMRQRQLALQALRTSIGSADMKATPLSPGYQQAYPNMNIKQEIQIPQVSSLTQSPDSSPSPIAIALGQVNASTGVIAAPMNGNGSAGGGGGNNNNNNNNNNSNTTSEVINRGATSNCHDAATGSLQNTAESKLCFDSGTHPSSSADSIIEPLRVSPMIREFVQSIDDREWQTQLFALLQKQTYNQVEVDLFELMCKVLDQNLFSQVDWARNTVFFKDLKVDDQMKLLQHSWSDMLVLDHLHQRIHNGLPDETQLNNGQVFNLLGLGLLGVPQLADYFNELQNKLQDLKFDMGDYVCMKFLILLNPVSLISDVRGIINKKTVLEGHENVQAALLDYTLTCYPSVTDKFRRLLNILPDIHAMASRGEEHLYSKHCAGSAPTQTLLMEMLHAKRKV